MKTPPREGDSPSLEAFLTGQDYSKADLTLHDSAVLSGSLEELGPSEDPSNQHFCISVLFVVREMNVVQLHGSLSLYPHQTSDPTVRKSRNTV